MKGKTKRASFFRANAHAIILILILLLFSIIFFAEISTIIFISPQILEVPFSWLWLLIVIGILFMVLRTYAAQLTIRYVPRAFVRVLLFHLLFLGGIVLLNVFLLSANIPSLLLFGIGYLEFVLLAASLSLVVLVGDVHVLQQCAKKIMLALGIGTILFFISIFIQSIWPFLSLLVARVVYFLITLVYPETAFYTSYSTYQVIFYENIPTVGAEDFGGIILKTCSGVEGLTLFFLLFTFIILLEWSRIKEKWKIAALYLAGTITMILSNMLRVFLLIFAGIRVSPEFATGALHSNVGWIFFTLVFIFFEFLSYRWMVRK